MTDARAAGYSSRESYAAARRAELEAALSLAGVNRGRVRHLELIDQEASFQLDLLATRIREIFQELRPEFVLPHPYEGGHPDHDATAFAVHTACRLVQQQGQAPPNIVEMASYHGRTGTIVTGEFLDPSPGQVHEVWLSMQMNRFKRRLFDCYKTQRYTLAQFSTEAERFRIAPVYDFQHRPHDGLLFYEHFDWNMTGRHWRQLAREALNRLGLNELPC